MIWWTFRFNFCLSFLLHLFLIFAEFFNTYLIYLAIQEVSMIPLQDTDLTQNKYALRAASYMLLFVVLRIGGGILTVQANFRLSVTGMDIRNGLNVMLFNKMTRRSLERDDTFDLGELTNLSQIDANSFAYLCNNLGFFSGMPFKIIIGVIGLLFFMGRAALYSSIIFALTSVANVYFASLYKIYREGQMKESDKRSRLISEVFNSVRFIKMMGLENFYLEKIEALRDNEIGWIKKQFIRNNISSFINLIGPAFFMITMFTINIYLTGELKLSDAFLTSMVFGIFQSSFRSLGPVIVTILDTLVSGRRLAFFLLAEEIDYTNREKVSADSPVAVRIDNGNFYWVNARVRMLYVEEKERISGGKPSSIQKVRGNVMTSRSSTAAKLHKETLLNQTVELDTNSLLDDRLVLKEISLSIPKGACVAVVGNVGSGKSSLLSAILGEVYSEKGTKVCLGGNLAYLSQTSWLVSTSLRDSILFGMPYNKKKLDEVIRCSGLEEDLAQLPHGLETILGDRGVNLSGGQKARVSLARSFYADRDIYLLDDPISALDVHVGKHVMKAGILGLLKDKTRIVATHALSYLPYFDSIILLDEGRIVAQGSYAELQTNGAFVALKSTIEKEEPQRKSSRDESEVGINMNSQMKKSNSQRIVGLDKKLSGKKTPLKTKMDAVINGIVAAEDKARGSVITFDILSRYSSYLGGKRILILSVLGSLSLISSNCMGIV
jgi:ABC-type multidrug transport system fused ATPase/permease subunit